MAQEEDSRYWDYNSDGKEDLRIKWLEDGFNFVEIYDRNFDGNDDLTLQFDSTTNWPIGALSDDDFNGTFETRTIYKNAGIVAVVSDSNSNELYDIAHSYKFGILYQSRKFIEDTEGRRIVTVTYRFEFPEQTSSQATTQTERQFHEDLKAEMSVPQSMPKKQSNRRGK